MYEAHFGLKEKPFSLIPDPESLYLSEKHKLAFTVLEYGLHEQVGITVITGEVGAGKTTLIRYLLSRMDYQKLTVGLISNTHAAFGSLLQLIAMSFDLDCQDKQPIIIFRTIQDYLVAQYAEGKRCVLIVDEAQNLDTDSLEALRLVSNINADKHQLLQIMLVGQPELRDLLKKPELFQVAQRVSGEFHLAPLSLIETTNYVLHRLYVAGSHLKIFDSLAIGAIYCCSRGIPRLINTLCDYTLVYAYGKGKKKVDLQIALEVINDKKIAWPKNTVSLNKEIQQMRGILKNRTGIDVLAVVNG